MGKHTLWTQLGAGYILAGRVCTSTLPYGAHQLVVGGHAEAVVEADIGGSIGSFGGAAAAVSCGRIAGRIRVVEGVAVKAVAFLAGGDGQQGGKDGKERKRQHGVEETKHSRESRRSKGVT